jgi:hypothetical protein
MNISHYENWKVAAYGAGAKAISSRRRRRRRRIIITVIIISNHIVESTSAN